MNPWREFGCRILGKATATPSHPPAGPQRVQPRINLQRLAERLIDELAGNAYRLV